MIARKDLLDKIIKYLDAFVLEVRSYNAIGAYDVNIHAENSLIPILNAVFDLELTNVNHQKKNFPAIDLVDAKNGVAFQITATSSMDKVSETLKKFVQNDFHKTYTTLFIYILTEKEGKYNDAKIKELTDGKLEFDTSIHIVDFTDILKRINAVVATEKLQIIARLFEHEFSDVQIVSRQKKFRDGFLKNVPEDLYLNLVKVRFSDRLYIAQTEYDEKLAGTLSRRMNKGKRKGKIYHPEALFKAIISTEDIYYIDWVIREDKLVTFRNLQDPHEPLTHFIDKGTVEAFNPADYYEDDADKLNIFKALLKNCLRHLCYTLSMEWVHERRILRFRNDEHIPREKKTNWRGKKDSVKTVIFEVMSKKKGDEPTHIVCFRNMAFEPNFHLLDDIWYLSINPTWSFTNPGGFKTSGYEAAYMSGIKRLETNNTVCYQFRFFAYFLSNIPPLFVEQYPHLKIERIPPVAFVPAIEDSKWIPPKEFVAKNARETELFEDKELNANSF